MKSYGNTGTYVGGTQGIPLPRADQQTYRAPHTPKSSKAKKFSWDNHRAPDHPGDTTPSPVKVPTRRCTRCAGVFDVDGKSLLCPECRDLETARFNAPTPPTAEPPSAPEPAEIDAPEPAASATTVEQIDATQLREVMSVIATAAAAIVEALDRIRPALADTPPTPAAPVTRPRRRPTVNATSITPAVRREATELLATGLSVPKIATRLGVGVKPLRAALKAAGVDIPDGRRLHSGGKPREYDDHTIAEVRRLYVDERLSQTEVAERLDLPYKTVVTIMRRHDIPRRQGEAGRIDGARGLKDAMAAAGVTSRQVKEWGLEHGHIDRISRGLPSQALVTAYIDAHREG